MRLSALAVLFCLSLCLGSIAAPIRPLLAQSPLPAFQSTLRSNHPLSGQIWLPGQSRFVDPAGLTAQAEKADLVLLGETHDNPDHHALQAWMLRHLGPRDGVVFEMMDWSQALAIADHLRDHPKDAAGLGAALGWDRSGWPDWDSQYRPVAQAALGMGARLGPGNLSRDDTRLIAKGDIPAAWAGKLGLETPQPPEDRQVMEGDIQAGHCGMMPPRALPAMVRVQRARDAALAWSLAQTGRGILIAGGGHVRADIAVPRHLARLAPGRTVFALTFLEVQDGKTSPRDYALAYDLEQLPFDAVWFTPAADRPDPCDAFRQHMEKKEKG